MGDGQVGVDGVPDRASDMSMLAVGVERLIGMGSARAS
jgi:hypothetical protein